MDPGSSDVAHVVNAKESSSRGTSSNGANSKGITDTKLQIAKARRRRLADHARNRCAKACIPSVPQPSML